MTSSPPKVQQATLPESDFWDTILPAVLNSWSFLLQTINDESLTFSQRRVLLELNTFFGIWSDHSRVGHRECCTMRSKFEELGQDWGYWKRALKNSGFHNTNNVPKEVLQAATQIKPDVALYVTTPGLNYRICRPLLPEEEAFLAEAEATNKALAKTLNPDMPGLDVAPETQ